MSLIPKTEEYEYSFSIAEVTFFMKCFQRIKVTDSFLPFMNQYKDYTWNIFYEECEDLPELTSDCVYISRTYDVWKDEDGKYIRCFKDIDRNGEIYAYSTLDLDNRKTTVKCLENRRDFFTETGNSLFHTGWERMLIQDGRLLFHASCIDTEFGGILFSGPSGIGKTTQSDLWCKYENAELINGDRPVLYQDDLGWKACGSPYAGSSQCHKNIACLINTIVILRKGSDNSIKRLDMGQAFRTVFSGMTVNSWDEDSVTKVCDMTVNLITEIKVYELTCTPDRNAVEILKNELEGRQSERN